MTGPFKFGAGDGRSMEPTERDRRRFLLLAGSVSLAGLAGCSAGDGGNGQGGEQLPEGVSEEEFRSGPVPEAYRTADSQAGNPRVPDDLVPKADVQFQEASDAVEEGLTQEGNDCANCAEYVPDTNGDGYGACAAVEGYIGPEDWCSLWVAFETDQES